MKIRYTKLVTLLSLLTSMLVLSGCSVGMAMSGEKDPDLTVVKHGRDRSEIEIQLGEPILTKVLEDGAIRCLYSYQLGNTPSAGRAIGHGVMDVMTFGMWEVLGTPIEACNGDKYQMTIVYDKENKVIDIKRSQKGKKLKKSSSRSKRV